MLYVSNWGQHRSLPPSRGLGQTQSGFGLCEACVRVRGNRPRLVPSVYCYVADRSVVDREGGYREIATCFHLFLCGVRETGLGVFSESFFVSVTRRLGEGWW
ncbi:hypothetical protein BaRGS_00002527 [Batillaria attramentaria]|uniref:Uncharacterized protein n=1 Tax=Batillaria attramentaria TaxID=370345 RepID=A0ABD0M4J6_9CAEN